MLRGDEKPKERWLLALGLGQLVQASQEAVCQLGALLEREFEDGGEKLFGRHGAYSRPPRNLPLQTARIEVRSPEDLQTADSLAAIKMAS